MLPAALLTLGSTQPLIEMSTRKFPWGYVGLTLPLSCAYCLQYPDSLIPLGAQGPILASTGKALPYPTFASTHSELTTASQHIQNKYVTAYRQALEVSPASHSNSLHPFCAAITMPTPPCNHPSSNGMSYLRPATVSTLSYHLQPVPTTGSPVSAHFTSSLLT
jgi:hypothetical protein